MIDPINQVTYTELEYALVLLRIDKYFNTD